MKLTKGWLYGLIVFLAQTCNPYYSANQIEEEAVFEDTIIMDEEYEIAEEAPPPPPPPPVREPPREQVFKVVEEMPRFPGCEDKTDRQERSKCADMKMLKFLYSQIQYPPEARKQGVQGTAIIQYVITENGMITDAKIIRDPGLGIGEEALRVVNMMPQWIPGKQRGKNVKVQFNLPVKFKVH